MSPVRCVVLAVASLSFVAVRPAGAEPKVEEAVVGPVGQGVRYFISPRGVHLASIGPKGSRYAVTYDGVAGPELDEVIKTDRFGGNDSPQTDYVVFSADGQRYAYVGRLGEEYVVVADGKEIYRAPYFLNAARGLGFTPVAPGSPGTPGSSAKQHVYFVAAMASPLKGGKPDNRLVVDGKPAAVGSGNVVSPVFSADGQRYAYPALRVENTSQKLLVVDGQDAGYYGEQPQFTGDGKHLLAIAPASAASPTAALLLDGKPAVQAANVAKIWTAPAGGRWAANVRKAGTTADALVVDGGEIPDAVNPEDVSFSPDGKRYAAKCRTPNGNRFIVLDGKKGREYAISEAAWAPDSSKFVYIAGGGGRSFAITDTQESDGYAAIQGKPVFGGGGKHVAYVASPEPGKTLVVLDGKPLPPTRGALGLTFSPDGSRFAYADNLPAIGPTALVLDGATEPVGYSGPITPPGPTDNDPPRVVFSPDGKHAAYMGVPPQNPAGRAIVLDGKLLPPASPTVSRGFFTPDGGHLFWVTWQPPRYTVFCDGKPVQGAGWEHRPELAQAIDNGKGNWEMGSDGVLTYLVPAAEGIKRVRVVAGGDTSLASLVADAQAAEAKAKADAQTAEAKAKSDAQAAQAAKDRAAAKAKADADAAAAAKAKARADAADAKAKARAEALEAARAKRPGNK